MFLLCHGLLYACKVGCGSRLVRAGLLKVGVATQKWVLEHFHVGHDNAICKNIMTVMTVSLLTNNTGPLADWLELSLYNIESTDSSLPRDNCWAGLTIAQHFFD